MVTVGATSSLFSSLIAQGRTRSAIEEQAAIVASGLRVNTIDDDVGAFITNVDLNLDASYLQTTQVALQNAETTINASISALTEVLDNLESAVNLAAGAVGGGSTTAVGTGTQSAFTALTANVASLVALGEVDGVNLLASNNLTVANVIGGGITASTDIVVSFLGTSAALGVGTIAGITTGGNASLAVSALVTDIGLVEGQLATLGAALSLVQAAATINSETQTSVETAATLAVEANSEKESARLTALQTQSDVGLTVLGIVSAGQRSVLALFQ